MNCKNAALMSRQKVIDKIADDRVGFVAKFGHNATDQGVAPAVPFQIDRPVSVAGAMKFRPAVRPSRLFSPNLDELEFFIQLRIAHDLAAQRSAPARDHMDHGLHR